MKECILSWTSGVIFAWPLDFNTCKQTAVLSSGSSNAACLGVAALTNLSHEFSDNPSEDAVSHLVGLVVVVGEVGEGNEASTIDCTSDLLSLEGLPFACLVQVASLMVSLMLLTMNSLVG